MSATTPEGRVKKKIKNLLDNYDNRTIYYEMNVPFGYGKPSLDFVGCVLGRFFAIEAKKPGAVPTDRQKLTIEQMRAAGGTVFIVDGGYSLDMLGHWLDEQIAERLVARRAAATSGSGRVTGP